MNEAISSDGPESISRKVSYLPSMRLWALWLLCLLGISVIRQQEIDLALVNIITAVLTGLVALSFLVWWCFGSSFPPAVRWLIPVLLLVGASAFSVRYRVVRTSGSLIPLFIRRGDPTADEQLPAVPTTIVQATFEFSPSRPSDFPKFLGPDGDSRIDGPPLQTDWSRFPPRKLWQREIGAGWSGFAAVNGYAVTMEQRGPQEWVTCYEVETGQPCWGHAIDARHETLFGAIGPRSTPTIYEGLVYAFGATGILRCLDANGQLVWQRDVLEDQGMTLAEAEAAVAWGRANSPLVIDQQVVIPVGGPRGGRCISLVSLDRLTGEPLWEGGECQASYASPALLTVAGVPQIVSVNEDFVSGHEIDSGRVLWTYPWDGRSDMNANVSQPHVVDERFIFLSKGYSKGAELVELTPAFDGPWNTETVWAGRVMKTKFSNVALRDGFAYGLDDGILSCVRLEDGKRMWKKGRYKYGQLLMVGNLLLVLGEEGELALVEANPDQFVELGRIQALEGQTWNTLCLTGNRLLVRNSEQAACFELATTETPLNEPPAPAEE